LKIARLLAAILFIGAGSLHFLKPGIYLAIMPPYIPWHPAMVYISGVFEILCGVGLLIPQTQRVAAWGLVALLIAVFPANLYMATDMHSIPAALRWGRLPVQLLLIWWVLWCSKQSVA
jgi:uncharacterized membrane protein